MCIESSPVSLVLLLFFASDRLPSASLTSDAVEGLTAAELLLGMGHDRIPILVPRPLENRKARLPPAAARATEQQLGGSTDSHRDSFVSEDAPKALRRDFVSGHFRQIFSILTRNGRNPARLRDGEPI